MRDYVYPHDVRIVQGSSIYIESKRSDARVYNLHFTLY